MTSKITKAREALLSWLLNSEEKVGYEAIRKACLYLDEVYGLGLQTQAFWTLFDPLLRHGVIEFTGNGCFSIPKPIAIQRKGIYVFTSNSISNSPTVKTPFTGIYRTMDSALIGSLQKIEFTAISVLKAMPSVKDVVEAFDLSVEDLSQAEYYHKQGKKGLTKRKKNGFIRYFYFPEKNIKREVPNKNVNPDAFNIAYSYSQSINSISSGKYFKTAKRLIISRLGLPIVLERILFLETITQGFTPIYDEYNVTFDGINSAVAKEINRILCKTLSYE